MMEKPPTYDLADPWDKLKEQDGDLTFKGAQGVREYFAKKGIDMTKKEAAKELGVSKATVDTYLSAGKLKGDGNGGVDDESVEVYKKKREENFKKMECAKHKVQCEVEKTTQQTIEEMEMQDDKDVIVFKVKELQEIVAKKVKDAYLKGIEAGKARLRAKRVQPDHLEKMVDIWAECAMQE